MASKEIAIEINAYKTKYLVMSRDQNVGRNHIMKPDNSFFERVDEFACLGSIITNKNSIQEEILSRLKSRNAFYNSV